MTDSEFILTDMNYSWSRTEGGLIRVSWDEPSLEWGPDLWICGFDTSFKEFIEEMQYNNYANIVDLLSDVGQCYTDLRLGYMRNTFRYRPSLTLQPFSTERYWELRTHNAEFGIDESAVTHDLKHGLSLWMLHGFGKTYDYLRMVVDAMRLKETRFLQAMFDHYDGGHPFHGRLF